MENPKQAGSLIRFIRGRRVMVDSDLARLYGVTTGNLNKAVRRNAERFPPDFMFRLTAQEHRNLRFQIGSLRWGQHSKYPPLAFTEQGVAMLSSVLHSRRAAQVNVAIMRAFVRLREAVAAHGELGRRLADIEHALADHGSQLGEHAQRISEGFEAIRRLMEAPEPPRRRIGFEGGRGTRRPDGSGALLGRSRR